MIERMAAPDDDDAFAATVAPAPGVDPKIAPVPVAGPLTPSVPKEAQTAHETASPTLTVAGSAMGTPAYMAPEQARGEAVDQRADVFALGAMLYHVLAGAPPYTARTAAAVLAAAALGKLIPLRAREK